MTGDLLELRTKRLRLTPLRPRDAEALHDLWTSRGVRRFLWDGEAIPRERTAEIVRESARLFEQQGFGLWGARRARRGDLLGFGGFWYFRDPPELELLFGVREDAWGRGFATELGRALIDCAFGRLRFERLLASTDAGNEASARVLTKLGFAPRGRRVVEGLDTLFFELVRTVSPDDGGGRGKS